MGATHTGICQVCGNRQKLPNGVLSNHGYTIEGYYRFFHGTCYGSKSLPYEKDCSLVKKSIENAKKHLLDLHAEIEAINAYKGDMAWVEYYNKMSKRAQEKVQITQALIDSKQFTTSDGKKHWFSSYSIYSNTVQEVVAQMNAKKVPSIEGEIRRMQEYIKTQEERILNWKEQDLVEIKSRS